MINLQGVCSSCTRAQAGRNYPPTTGLAFGRHYMAALSALQGKSRDLENLNNTSDADAEQETSALVEPPSSHDVLVCRDPDVHVIPFAILFTGKALLLLIYIRLVVVVGAVEMLTTRVSDRRSRAAEVSQATALGCSGATPYSRLVDTLCGEGAGQHGRLSHRVHKPPRLSRAVHGAPHEIHGLCRLLRARSEGLRPPVFAQARTAPLKTGPHVPSVRGA